MTILNIPPRYCLRLLLFVCASNAYGMDVITGKILTFETHAISDGFKGIQFVNFKDGGDRSYAIKHRPEGSIQKPVMYTAELHGNTEGNPHVTFRLRDNCDITYPKLGVIEKVFTVNGQRVNMMYGCQATSEQEKTTFVDTVALFWPASDAGKKYVSEQFIKRNWVFLHHKGIDIPFSAIGFTDLWNKANKPAL